MAIVEVTESQTSESISEVSGSRVRSKRPRLPLRLRVVIAILALEFVAVSVLPHPSLHLLTLGPTLVGFAVMLVLLGYKQFTEPVADDGVIGCTAARLHLCVLGCFLLVELAWPFAGLTLTGIANLHDAPWGAFVLLPVALLVTLGFAAFPTRAHRERFLFSARTWLYAAAATLVVVAAFVLSQAMWNDSGSATGAFFQRMTFASAAWLLRLFYPTVIAMPAAQTVGTGRFEVTILGGCSGVEGLFLVLVMSVCWLLYMRRELRMERAIWLVPLTLAAVWCLNLVRITALIALGDAGYGDVAVHGFHSEAGWILFNLVGLGFLVTANHVSWLRKEQGSESLSAERNVAMVYLLPFVAMMTAAMLGRAASSQFDWLYPLRLVAGAAVFAWLWGEYRRGGRAGIDWGFGWLGMLAGAVVFAMWLGLARWQHLDGSLLAGQLQALSAGQRVSWIVARVLTAVIVVPIAEELAFRGYLARRLMSADIEAVPFASLSVVAMLGSSLVFGVMHGHMWFAGAIAGLIFAGVAKKRGRLGEAVAAHAVANLLIAIWVLSRGDFGMW